MTLDKLIELGIAAKITNEIFVYHVTGYFLDVHFHGNSRTLTFKSSIDGKVYEEKKLPHYIDFEDFIETVKPFAKKMHESGHVPQMFGVISWN